MCCTGKSRSKETKEQDIVDGGEENGREPSLREEEARETEEINIFT